MNIPMTPDKLASRALIGGKKTEKLEARCSEELKEAVRRKWHDAGYASESEWLEMLAAVACFGIDHVRNVQLSRLEAGCALSDTDPTRRGL